MDDKRRRLLIPGMGVMGGANKPNLKFYCTTTGAATLTIAALTVITGKTVVVDWGDGSSNTYTAGAGARTHDYTGAGTFTVKITPPTDIIALTLSDNKVTLNSADIKAGVNITSFTANGLKAGKFDSADVSAWRPTSFYLYSMPSGYAGTFNSSDVSAWRPTELRLYSMPSGYAGTFNSSDVSAWRPTYFRLYSMPVATYTITISDGGFDGWNTKALTFQMQGNSLSQAQVDQILSDFWTGYSTRTAAGGSINVGGSNAAPSGTLQAANPPTTGKEFAYELVNDSQNINPTKKWTTVTITA